jgi:hypothetical protein
MTPLLRNLGESCRRYQILGYIYGEYTGKLYIYGYMFYDNTQNQPGNKAKTSARIYTYIYDV